MASCAGSGQCAYPSDLDSESAHMLEVQCSGQCAYPSDLDSNKRDDQAISVPASAHIPVI